MDGESARRARSYGAVAAAYAEHRPGYPAAAVAWALEPLDGPGHLLDLGAGTGKLTERLLERPGARVTAVEPDPQMLAELRARFPAADAQPGSAEAVPLPDASVDAVLVGQAWHWFDAERAVVESVRVLRPGGVLVAMWNGEDVDVPWVAGLNDTAGRLGRPAPGSGGITGFPEHPGLAPTATMAVANPLPTTTERTLAWLGTHSWVLAAPHDDRVAFEQRARAYLAARPETSSGTFALPLVTTVLRALRR